MKLGKYEMLALACPGHPWLSLAKAEHVAGTLGQPPQLWSSLTLRRFMQRDFEPLHCRQSNGQRGVGSKIIPAYLSYLTKFARGRPSGFSSFFGFATCKFFGFWVHGPDLTPTGVPGSKILQTSQGLWSTPT